MKKNIAREGLIIIALIFLSGVSYYSHSLITEQRNIYESTVQEIVPVIKEGKYLIEQGIRLQFPKNTSDDVIKRTLGRDYPNVKREDWIILDNPQAKNTNAFYDENGNPVFDSFIYNVDFSDVSFILLFIAYPIYLTIRFIIWAIKTLIKTPTNALQ